MASFNDSKAILTIVALIGGGALSINGIHSYEIYQHRMENQALADEIMQVEFTDEFDIMECAAEQLDVSQLVISELDEAVTLSMYPETIDLSVPGNRSVNFFLEFKDDLNEVHRKQVAKTITVQDTAKPVIDAQEGSVDLWQYAGFDASDYVNSVNDAVSGDLELADELAPGKYTISSDVDTNTAGTYTVTVKAQDYHGNTEEKSFEVAVHEKPVYQQPTYSGGGASYAYSGGGGSYYQDPGSYSGGSSYFGSYYVANNVENYQGAIDSGNIARIGEDYFHHNDSAFMNQFWNTSAGDTVTLNGINYTCTGIEHGYVGEDRRSIYTDSGNDIYVDGNPNLITCDGDGDQRWIMHLEETGN